MLTLFFTFSKKTHQTHSTEWVQSEDLKHLLHVKSCKFIFNDVVLLSGVKGGVGQGMSEDSGGKKWRIFIFVWYYMNMSTQMFEKHFTNYLKNNFCSFSFQKTLKRNF